MKRTAVLALSLLTLALLSACATVFPAPAVKGVITQVNADSVVVTPEGGAPATISLSDGTRVYWTDNTLAGPALLARGQTVHVWVADSTQNATKILITRS